MRNKTLNGSWQFRERGDDTWLSATVPGGVYSDLLSAGEIPDPFYEDNELDVQWVGETDWEYRRTVTLDPAFLDHDRLLLQCEGLDTVATVSVNGEVVGTSNNMHVGYEFDVSDAIVAGENEITVAFDSPVEYGIEQAASHPYDVPAIRYPVDQPARSFIRKAQCHYGWDWGPCLPTMGIFRDISLVAHSEPRITHTTTEQHHDGDTVELDVRVGVDAPRAGEYTLEASVADATVSETVSLEAGEQAVDLTLSVEDPDLWWPAGYGDQPLYDLRVAVGEDESRSTVGFRELDLVVEPDDAGTSFYFEVNGTQVFAKGANTIPIAPMYADVTEERYEHLIESAVEANMNMLRVWGGGYYENDAFYELCNEHGLLVWQDFMFACALYPADDEFLDTVEDEVRHQVRRLADHPSIALWCGNNENEEALHNWFEGHEAHDQHVEDYDALYEDTVGRVCREEDPSRTYWPGSPSSGPGEDDPYIFEKGDIHYWDVWHAGEPFENYYTTEPRFVSEFGYQSFPSTDSLSTVLDESAFNPTAPLMEHHQRSPNGNSIILQRMTDYFRVPLDFDSFVYLSQVQHGLAMKTAIEYWRRRKPTTMGTLYWQLNDLWPVASWASIEYDGKWKAQQYMARRQYAPVLVSFHPEYESAAQETIESQTLWLTSDVPDPIEGTVTLEVVQVSTDEVLRREEIQVDVDAQASTDLLEVDREDLPDGVAPDDVMLRAVYDGPGESYPNVGFFEDFKSLDLPEPDLAVEVDGTSVTVSAASTALFVALDPGSLLGNFSDNYFHLAPDETRTVTFESREDRRPAAVANHLRDSLSVTHLRETY